MPERENMKKEFEELFRRNYSRLFYCALDLVDDSEMAKDIVGDACMEMWRKFDLVREPNPDGYLYATVRNRAINHLRRLATERQYTREMLALKEEAALPEPDVQEERLQRVGEVVALLPQQTQTVFGHCCMEGKSYKEVATLLGVSTSAIHKHVSRAMAALRTALAEKRTKNTFQG